jgi:uncharacterized protein (TIGR00251 family)
MGGTLIRISIVTNAIRDEIAGFDKWRGRILVRIREKPVHNKANKAIVKFFSTLLDLKCRDVKIISGEKSNLKRIEVKADVDKVRQILEK